LELSSQTAACDVSVRNTVHDFPHCEFLLRTGQPGKMQLATCARLAPGASGVVRSGILVARNTPQHLERIWEVTAADIRWTDALYPLAQHAMQRGYKLPNRNSRHCSRHQCPYWRRCEQDFGGVVEVMSVCA
jgi:hypothetical protein